MVRVAEINPALLMELRSTGEPEAAVPARPVEKQKERLAPLLDWLRPNELSWWYRRR